MTLVRARSRRARWSMRGGTSAFVGTDSARFRKSSRSSRSVTDMEDLFPERFQPARHERLHRARSTFEELCGLGLGEVQVEPEDKGRALSFREFEEGVSKELARTEVWFRWLG